MSNQGNVGRLKELIRTGKYNKLCQMLIGNPKLAQEVSRDRKLVDRIAQELVLDPTLPLISALHYVRHDRFVQPLLQCYKMAGDKMKFSILIALENQNTDASRSILREIVSSSDKELADMASISLRRAAQRDIDA